MLTDDMQSLFVIIDLCLILYFSFLRCACLQGFCLPVSFPKSLQSSTVKCALSSESEFVLVVGIHFALSRYVDG